MLRVKRLCFVMAALAVGGCAHWAPPAPVLPAAQPIYVVCCISPSDGRAKRDADRYGPYDPFYSPYRRRVGGK